MHANSSSASSNSLSSAWCVLYINKSRGSSLLWCPVSMERMFIQKADAKLGAWYNICKSTKTLTAAKPLFETRVHDDIVEIKAPVVFFRDKKFRHMVGYAPGFGRVGCFISACFQEEKMYSAWIAYMEFSPQPDLHTLMNIFDIAWIICDKSSVKMEMTELHYISEIQVRGAHLIKGIVVEREGASGKILTCDDGIFYYGTDPKNDIPLGQFVKFFPMTNFSDFPVAVHVYELSEQKGIKCLQTTPELKLSVSQWDRTADGLINVPGMFSTIVDQNDRCNSEKTGNLEIVYDKLFMCFLVPKTGKKRDSIELDEDEMAGLIADLEKLNADW